SPVSPVLSVTPQMPTLSMNSHDSTDYVNLEQTQSAIIANAMELHSSPEVNSNNISVSERIVSHISGQKNNQSKSQNASSGLLQISISQSKDDLASELDQSEIKSPCPDPQSSTNQVQAQSGISPELSITPPKIAEASTLVLKIPYNQKVERGLRREISVCDQDNSNEINTPCAQIGQSSCIPNIASDNTFDVQIPEFFLETILTGSDKVTAQNIVDLFNIAMKIRQKEILYWHCYYKAYEDRIRNIRSINKINDKSARMLVYNEIKSLLPDITDTNTEVSMPSTSRPEKVILETVGSVLAKNISPETKIPFTPQI
ncbi:2663_t:CDS:2, partial [Diversispora eburnea]